MARRLSWRAEWNRLVYYWRMTIQTFLGWCKVS